MVYFTEIYLGRAMTEAEIEAHTAYRIAEYNAGNCALAFYGAPTAYGTDYAIRMWTSLESANSYITFFNTFDPPPVSTKIFS